MMNDSSIKPLNVLINEQLSSVIFVQNYLQLDFDGNCITCNIWPKIYNGKYFEYTMTEYKNILCELISKKVTLIKLKDGELLNIYFEDNFFLSFELSTLNPKIGNALILDTTDGEWAIY